MRRIPCATLSILASLCVTTLASAQPGKSESYFARPERAPAKAFEITLGTGYTQGFGRIKRGAADNINDVANAGIGLDLGLGYRISPKVGLALVAGYQEFSVTETSVHATGARGFLTGIEVTYHFDPDRRFSPWVRGGTAYRMLWLHTNGPTTLFHGFDLLRLAAGFDVRTSPSFALGPMMGVDVDVFLWKHVSGTDNTAIAGPRASTYFFAGVQGRFDIVGTTDQQVARSF